MMLGPMIIKRIDATKPVPNPHTAPRVVNRFQNKDKIITGRLAEAATANANATKNATFALGPSKIAMAIATAPTTNAVTRATRTSSPGLRSVPRCMTFV